MRDVGFLSGGLLWLLCTTSSVDAFVLPGSKNGGGWTGWTVGVPPIQDVGSPSKIGTSIKPNEVLAAAALLFVTAMTAPVTVHVQPPSKHISIQLASASALTEQQVLVDDVWREVTRQFVDKTYNGLGEDGWRQKRLEAVKKVATVGPDDTEVVYSTIRTMLKALGDPALEAVVLLKLEGYSNVEIAEKMKYSRRTIQRMLELVKDIWGQYVEE